MPSQSNANVALNNTSAAAASAGDVTPGLAPLAPPAGAYFGRQTHTEVYTSQSRAVPDDVIWGAGATQTLALKSFSEFFVYWINGSASIAGSYLIIQRQSLSFSTGPLLLENDNRYRGWMLSDVRVSTITSPPTSGQATLLASSPNAGDQQAGVKQGMTLNVFAGASGRQPRYIEVADQSPPFNLTGWATRNISQTEPQWKFRQTTPWDPQAAALGQGNDQGDWGSIFFNNGVCVAFPDISQSSLALTTYTTWIITDPAWTHDAPQVCTFLAFGDMWADYYLVWAPSGGKDGRAGYASGTYADTFRLPDLILDKIVQQIPASP